MIDTAQFYAAEAAVRAAGYGSDIEWSEGIVPPADPDAFASEAIFVICNSGMRFTVARDIYTHVMAALCDGCSAGGAFGHKGKVGAIDYIWSNRTALLAGYLAAADKLEWCGQLPWIGPITKYHLAKNFGADVAKPDVHLQRLADAEGCTAQELCDRLAGETGYRAATVDVVLWRACALGAIKSRELAQGGSVVTAVCPSCGGSGFSGHGTGYDDVCAECGGQRCLPCDSGRLPQGEAGTAECVASQSGDGKAGASPETSPPSTPSDQTT